MYTTEFFLWSGKFPVACTAEISQELSLLGHIEVAEHTPRGAVLALGPAFVDGVHSQGKLLHRKLRGLSAIPGGSRFLHAGDCWAGRFIEGSLVRLVFEFFGSTVGTQLNFAGSIGRLGLGRQSCVAGPVFVGAGPFVESSRMVKPPCAGQALGVPSGR